ncbi:hypothetical protein RhiirA4_448894 [Rhizophagus irregularis]|uniref:Uncharacterized protein n=1 Tax=Rhizophagus irregularis TaxID=588596 RepID=A0A2I1HDN3_9GLOM|nr:hypothetical protein RhiirA4_448894 [Rhizophagus irregularis]
MVLKDVFSVDPPRGVIHIIVKMPTPTPATTGKRKLDLDDVNEDQDRKKSKLTVSEKILTSSQKIMEDIKKLPDDPNVYSNPENLISLPFPFIGERRPVERFSIRDNKFLYMGRKAFDKVLKTINELESGNGYMDFFIYGTMGYGKSYILATISSSANNTSALHLSIKQVNKKKIELYGGFDEPILKLKVLGTLEVEIIFIWITRKNDIDYFKEGAQKKLQGRDIEVNPEYTWVVKSFKNINIDLENSLSC